MKTLKIASLSLVFVLLPLFDAVSQNVDEIFKERKYKEVIEILADKERFQKLSFKNYFLLSMSYNRTDKFYNSLSIVNKIILEASKIDDTKNLFKAFNLKAENLFELSMTEKGIRFCDYVLPIFEKNDTYLLQDLCIKCGVFYDQSDLHDKAFKTYNKIKRKDLKESAIFSNNYGVILMNLEKYDEALIYLKKGVAVSYKIKQFYAANLNLSNIAKIFMHKGQWKDAEKYLDSASTMFTQKSKPSHKKKIYEYYYHFYKYQGKLDKALEVLDHIEINNDLVLDEKINEKKLELEAVDYRKYILNKKVTRISQSIKKSKEQKLLSYIILLTVIIIISITIFTYLYKSINLKYLNIINEQEILASQMTPHFIFNSLSVLQGMILNEEAKKATGYLSKFSNLLKLIIKEGGSNFNALEEELSGLRDYIDLQNMSSERIIESNIIIADSLKEKKIFIPSMMLQPFVENSIIHGFREDIKNPMINLKMRYVGKKLICIIEDNGVGYLSGNKKVVKEKTSLAVQIIKDRLDILSRKSNIKTSLLIEDLKRYNQRGTRVTIELPYIISKKDNDVV